MKNNEVTLTQAEIEEIKDDVKFKTKVIEHLKRLNGLPEKVTKLEIHSSVHWFLISIMLIGIIGMVWRMLVR